jgi:hypothetical protein
MFQYSLVRRETQSSSYMLYANVYAHILHQSMFFSSMEVNAQMRIYPPACILLFIQRIAAISDMLPVRSGCCSVGQGANVFWPAWGF